MWEIVIVGTGVEEGRNEGDLDRVGGIRSQLEEKTCFDSFALSAPVFTARLKGKFAGDQGPSKRF